MDKRDKRDNKDNKDGLHLSSFEESATFKSSRARTLSLGRISRNRETVFANAARLCCP